ncbi:MAG: Asp-tRNA(Asn)/Glu-tRNA(Gln) amidotransferase subunit GatA [Patescibacteria group bacterium]
MTDFWRLSAAELAGGVRSGGFSACEITRAFLARAERLDADLHAFNTLAPDYALACAESVDRRRAAGETLGPLAGVPVALKDNISTRGVPTTCSSAMLEGYVPPYDATVVERIRAADGVPFGKTNMDEFAMGSSTENSARGPTRNPWDPSRVPGGSSGGSAAAVAAGLAPLALGSDTGGSIRLPASFCGVVGMKPTYGLVSRYGLIAFASSLDQIGPMARTPQDAALLLGVLAGHDERDSTSIPRAHPDYRDGIDGSVRGLRLGMPREYFGEGLAPQVREAVLAAVEVLKSLGAEVAEVSLPTTVYALAAYYLIAPAEASSNLARYDGVRYGLRVPGEDSAAMFMATRAAGFGPEVKRRIMVGTYALSAGYYDAYYKRAQQARTLIRRDFERAFTACDALITPTAPVTAFALGERAGDPLAMYLADVCTVTANLAGIPAISLPCGFVDGLPVGMQFLGPAFGEGVLLRLAAAYQKATAWHERRPPGYA